MGISITQFCDPVKKNSHACLSYVSGRHTCRYTIITFTNVSRIMSLEDKIETRDNFFYWEIVSQE